MRRYGHFKFLQDGGGRHLGFVRIGNSAIRSAVPENPTLEQNMKWIGSPVAEIWPFASLGKPRSGSFFDEMVRDKLRYKLSIKTKREASAN